MVTYIVLTKFTDQGIRDAKDSPKRADAFKQMAKTFGMTVKDIFWTQGRYDIVTIVEAPRKERAQHLLDRTLRIDAARIDRKASALGRKPAFGLGESLLVPDQVHQVGGVLAIVDRELGIEADLVGVVAQQTRADAEEGAGPGQGICHDAGIVAHHLAGNAFDPLCVPKTLSELIT